MLTKAYAKSATPDRRKLLPGIIAFSMCTAIVNIASASDDIAACSESTIRPVLIELNQRLGKEDYLGAHNYLVPIQQKTPCPRFSCYLVNTSIKLGEKSTNDYPFIFTLDHSNRCLSVDDPTLRLSQDFVRAIFPYHGQWKAARNKFIQGGLLLGLGTVTLGLSITSAALDGKQASVDGCMVGGFTSPCVYRMTALTIVGFALTVGIDALGGYLLYRGAKLKSRPDGAYRIDAPVLGTPGAKPGKAP